jgi:hypothetical protein
MKKRRIFIYAVILCFAASLGLFGALSLYGQGYDGEDESYNRAYIAYDTENAINTDSYTIFGIYLQDDMAVAGNYPDFDVILTNITGHGNIVITSGYHGKVLLNDVNISGKIIVEGTDADADGFVNLTLINSNVDSIDFYGPGKVNVLQMAGEAASPNVVINFPGIHLIGNFNRVYSHLHDGLIFLDGNIDSFCAMGNVVLIGAGNIRYLEAPEGVIVEVLDPNGPGQCSPEELAALFESLLTYHLGQLELLLLEQLGGRFDTLDFNLPNLNIPTTTIINMPQAPQPTASPSPSPAPEIPVMPPPPSPPPSPSPDPNLPNADAFFIATIPIKGPFYQIYIRTHYLGQLSRDNFLIYFDGEREQVDGVSPFNHSGEYYVITLLNTLEPAAGRMLRVVMRDLPNHIPHPYPVSIEPEPLPTTPSGPSLDVTYASVGEQVKVRNFPQSPGYRIYLSTVHLNESSDLFLYLLTGQVIRVYGFNPADTKPSFHTSLDTPTGLYRVYIVNDTVSPLFLKFVDTLDIRPALGAGSIDFGAGIIGGGLIVVNVNENREGDIDAEVETETEIYEQPRDAYVPEDFLEYMH